MNEKSDESTPHRFTVPPVNTMLEPGVNRRSSLTVTPRRHSVSTGSVLTPRLGETGLQVTAGATARSIADIDDGTLLVITSTAPSTTNATEAPFAADAAGTSSSSSNIQQQTVPSLVSSLSMVDDHGLASWLNQTFSNVVVEPRFRLGERRDSVAVAAALVPGAAQRRASATELPGYQIANPADVSSNQGEGFVISVTANSPSTDSGLPVDGKTPLPMQAAMVYNRANQETMPNAGKQLREGEAMLELLASHGLPLLQVNNVNFDLFAVFSALEQDVLSVRSRNQNPEGKRFGGSTMIACPQALLARTVSENQEHASRRSGEATSSFTSSSCDDRQYSPQDLFVYVSANIFLRFQLLESLDLDVTKLIAFLRCVQGFYFSSNPYHNSLHAADVLHSCFLYLINNNVWTIFYDEEILCLLLSAAVHDIGHLGVSNPFLQMTAHPVSRLYNNRSPMENLHASLAFHLLSDPALNFFSSDRNVWNEEQTMELERKVVEMVLGTDMRQHAKMVESVRNMLRGGTIGEDDVEMLMVAILHAADLSNPMKPWSIYTSWAHRVCAEFWRQGDEESRRGMKLLPQFDRNISARFPEMQVGFMTFVVKPFVLEIASVLPEAWLHQLDENIEHMKRLCGRAADASEYEGVAEVQQLSVAPWVDQWSSVLAPQVSALIRQNQTSRNRHALLDGGGIGHASVGGSSSTSFASSGPNSGGEVPISVPREAAAVHNSSPQTRKEKPPSERIKESSASDESCATILAAVVQECFVGLASALQRALQRLFTVPADSKLAIEEVHEGFAGDCVKQLQRLRVNMLTSRSSTTTRTSEYSKVLRDLNFLLGSDCANSHDEDDDDDERSSSDPDWCVYLMRTIWCKDKDDVESSEATDAEDNTEVTLALTTESKKLLSSSTPTSSLSSSSRRLVDLHAAVKQNTQLFSLVVLEYTATLQFTTTVSDTTANRGMGVYYHSSTTDPAGHDSPPTSGRMSVAPLPIPRRDSHLDQDQVDTSSEDNNSVRDNSWQRQRNSSTTRDSSPPAVVTGLKGLRSKVSKSVAPQLQRYFPLFQTGWSNPNATLAKLANANSPTSRRLPPIQQEQALLAHHHPCDYGGSELDDHSNYSPTTRYSPTSSLSPSTTARTQHVVEQQGIRIAPAARSSSFRGNTNPLTPQRGLGASNGSRSVEPSRGGGGLILPSIFGTVATSRSSSPNSAVAEQTGGGGAVAHYSGRHHGGGHGGASPSESPPHRNASFREHVFRSGHHPATHHAVTASMEEITISQFGGTGNMLDTTTPDDQSQSSLTPGQLQRIADTGAAVPAVYLRSSSMRSLNSLSQTPR